MATAPSAPAPMTQRTSNPNNAPRVNSISSIARSGGLTYNRGNSNGKERKDTRQARS